MYGVTGSHEPFNVLLIESDEATSRRYASRLQRFGVRGLTAVGEADAEPLLTGQHAGHWDVIVLSLSGQAQDAEAPLRNIKRHHPHCSIIVLSSSGSLSQAVECMRMGADDFLIKPVSDSQLAEAVLRTQAPAAAEPQPRRTGNDTTGEQELVGSSDAMSELKAVLQRAASSKATVFLKGESGTGKELCAQAAHRLSPRAEGPMISINCSAIPRELMESEIFGHEKGAFTGAVNRREGAAELAHGGTLFLDEICEMDLALQAKLLRFIQTGQFMRVGGSQLLTVDVRFVCATNKDPMEEVRAGTFREDLFYRLHVLPVMLPPLRERGRDVIDIARSALDRFAAEEDKSFRCFHPDAEDLLLGYWWPGNVRELLNVIRNVVVMNEGSEVTAQMLPLAMAHASGMEAGAAAAMPQAVAPVAAAADDVLKPLWQHEQEIIERAITACDGNVGKAAAHLEINPSTIYRKRQSWTRSGAA